MKVESLVRNVWLLCNPFTPASSPGVLHSTYFLVPITKGKQPELQGAKAGTGRMKTSPLYEKTRLETI